MINAIKTIIKNYIENANLSNMQYGTVIKAKPLQIQIEKIIIPSTKIIVPSYLGITLKENDRILLLKQQGGQLFFILDKV